MKAIVYQGPEKIEVKDVPMIAPKGGWTLVKVSHVGVCGSDITIYYGKHPRAKAPLIMGHEFSGYIASENPDLPMGTLVTAFPYIPCHNCERCENGQFHVCKSLKLIGIDLDGGMAEYVQVPDEMIYPVPEGISPALAAFIEPVGISVHATRKGGYRPGCSVLVFGAGAIGLATAITLRACGAYNLVIAEPNHKRAALARELGFDVLDPGMDTLAQIHECTNGDGFEFVYDCAGVQPVIDMLPDAVKINGTIVIVAGYKNPPTMDFQKGMFREFSINFVRNCTSNDFVMAIDLISRDLGYEKLLNCILSPDDAEKGFKPNPEAYKVIYDFGGSL